MNAAQVKIERDKKGLDTLRLLKAEWDAKEVSDEKRENEYYIELKERIAKLELSA